jgi:putative peptidoglycan lipid II flippase
MAGVTGVVPTPPPPAPRPQAQPQTFAQSERRWLVPTLLIVIIATALGLAGLLFGQTEVGHDLLDRTLGNTDESNDPTGGPGDGGDAGGAVQVVGATAFDPFGTGAQGEHDGDAPKAVDGNAETGWTTEQYSTRNLGGNKPGVGLVVEVEGSPGGRSLHVTSPTRGWSAQIFVGDDPAAWQAGPTAPMATIDNSPGDATVDLGDTSGKYVLIWITQLGEQGPQFTATINEVAIS